MIHKSQLNENIIDFYYEDYTKINPFLLYFTLSVLRHKNGKSKRATRTWV